MKSLSFILKTISQQKTRNISLGILTLFAVSILAWSLYTPQQNNEVRTSYLHHTTLTKSNPGPQTVSGQPVSTPSKGVVQSASTVVASTTNNATSATHVTINTSSPSPASTAPVLTPAPTPAPTPPQPTNPAPGLPTIITGPTNLTVAAGSTSTTYTASTIDGSSVIWQPQSIPGDQPVQLIVPSAAGITPVSSVSFQVTAASTVKPGTYWVYLWINSDTMYPMTVTVTAN